MKPYVLAAAALFAATSSQAGVMTVAGSYAAGCYSSAERRAPTPAAIAECDQALTVQTLSPDDRLATHVNRGILEMLVGQGEAALADYHAAMAIDPRHPEPYLNKSVLIFDGGDGNREAVALAQQALALGTKRPGVALYVVALAKEDAGDVRAAYADLVRSAQLEPDWKLPREQLARYRVQR